jgi:hypothetical protein
VWDFASACNELGLRIPLLISLPPDPAIDPDHLWYPDDPLFADELIDHVDLLRLVGLAQHHGIPTRLLDWSSDPIAAAFFAAVDLLPSVGDAIVVWALHKERASRVEVRGVRLPYIPGQPTISPRIYIDRPLSGDNPYLAAQSGWLFTTIRNSGIYYMQHNGLRPSLEDFVAESNSPDIVLRKLILPHEYVADLRQLLYRENVSRGLFMPTMDNVAKDVIDKWRRY